MIFNFEFWIGPATSLTQSPDAGRGRAVKDAKEYRGGMIFPRVRGTRLRVDFGFWIVGRWPYCGPCLADSGGAAEGARGERDIRG